MNPSRFIVAFIGEGGHQVQFRMQTLATPLRREGVVCHVPLAEKLPSFKAQFKRADKLNARFAVILGSKETKAGTCTLKDMKAGTQKELPQQALQEALEKETLQAVPQ